VTPAARCENTGLLVNAKQVLPADPHELYLPGGVRLIGCNQLRCTACGSTVRQQAGVWVSQAGSLPAALFAADWAAAPAISAQPVARLYACPCGWWNQITDCTMLDESEPMRPTPPWACAGHPPILLPCEVDGVALEPGFAIEVLVRRVMVDREPAPAVAAVPPCAWLAKLYQLLVASPNGHALASPLARAVADLLPEAGDVELRAQIIEFFRIVPGASGAEALVGRYLVAPSELVGVRRSPRCRPRRLDDLFTWFLRARVGYLRAQNTPIDDQLSTVIVRGVIEARRRMTTREPGAKQTAGEWLETLQSAALPEPT
jgi:hypothetical protein